MEIDLIQVKGKKQPEAVFTVLGRAEVERGSALPGIARSQRADARSLSQAAMGRGAERLIERCRKLADGFGVAGLYEMYVERIAVYRAEPPPPDWNGVYEAESK